MLPSRVKPLRRQLFFQSALIILLAVSTHAYEVDNFTNRNQVPKDSTELIDKEIQRRLQVALTEANANLGSLKCNDALATTQTETRKRLFNALRKQLENMSPIGTIERWAVNNNAVSKRVVPASSSIYSDSLNKSLIVSVFGIGPTVVVNGEQIGTDKLGHFFNEGYTVYSENYHRSTDYQKYSEGLFLSMNKEDGIHGLTTTNIYSYADIVANHEGQKFWERICGNANKDTSKSEAEYIKNNRCSSQAYYTCDNTTGKWAFNPKNKFTFKDYVNVGWDETVNCSLYASEVVDKITQQMRSRATQAKGNPQQPCPLKPERCEELEKKYSTYRKQVISPICRRISNDKSYGETISKNEKFIYDFNRQDEILKIKTTTEPSTPSSTKVRRAN